MKSAVATSEPSFTQNRPPRSDRSSSSSRLLPYVLISPAILLVAAVTGIGILYAIQYSFYNATLAAKEEFVGLDNYRAIFADQAVRDDLITTFKYMAFTVPLSVGLGLAFALLINRKVRGIAVVRTILILPWVTSLVITALLWRFLLNQDYGPLVSLLESLGLPTIEFLGPQWAMASLVVTSAWNAYAFSMVLFLAALQQVPTNVKQAVQIDGAGAWLVFRKVTFPYIKPTLAVAVVIGSMHFLNLIELPLVLTGGGPGNMTQIFPLRLYTEAFSYYNTGLASAMAVVVLVLNLVLTAVYLRVLRDRRLKG